MGLPGWRGSLGQELKDKGSARPRVMSEAETAMKAGEKYILIKETKSGVGF